MKNIDRLFLVGFMGAGKSSLGEKLAKSLSLRFIDLDVWIEKKTKKSISEIFADEGEEAFRLIEKDALLSFKNESKIVIATGGGCASFEDNMQWMNEHGTSIYISCSPGVLFHRIAPEKKKRPLISQMDDVDIMEYIQEKLAERNKYYLKANVVVDGDGEVEDVVVKILIGLKK